MNNNNFHKTTIPESRCVTPSLGRPYPGMSVLCVKDTLSPLRIHRGRDEAKWINFYYSKAVTGKTAKNIWLCDFLQAARGLLPTPPDHHHPARPAGVSSKARRYFSVKTTEMAAKNGRDYLISIPETTEFVLFSYFIPKLKISLRSSVGDGLLDVVFHILGMSRMIQVQRKPK